LGNVLSEEVEWRQGDGGSTTIRGVESPADQTRGAPRPPDPEAEAEAFVRFCYRRRAVAWPELYDEMCAVAARGEYRGMDYEELARLGLGFGLPSLPRLAELAARVIAQERTHRPVAAVA
jgi:hypothetical protein